MAILSSIRSKSWLLIVFVGLALFMFVANPDDLINFFSSKKSNSVGEINGEYITREYFTERVKQFTAANGNTNDSQASMQVWESIVGEKILDEQLKKAGIVVGEKEIWKTIIESPGIKDNPQFLNEAGLFDEESLKTFIAEMKDDKTEQGKAKWVSWLDYERQVKQNLERNAYFSAISAGLGIPLETAKREYINTSTRVTGKFVILPYTAITDSLVKINDDEIEDYINAHKNLFKTNATRNLRYVVFNVVPSDDDRKATKEEITKLVNNYDEYNASSKTNDTVRGFKNTQDYVAFVADNSDLPLDNNFIFKTTQPQVTDSLFNLPVGTVIGPYEDNAYFKISKLVESKQVPSAKASHILISYNEVNPNAALTKDEAKAKTDALFAKIKAGADFAVEAQTNSEDPGSATRGGDLDWFKEGMMVPEFNDWTFSHNVGEVGVVETQYGYHIIKKTDTKSESGIKVATVAKAIEPSDATSNKAFEKAESFNSAVSKNPKDFEKLAKENKLEVRKADNVGRNSQNIAGLQGTNTQIVYWAFDAQTNNGDVERFDLDNFYVIAQLTDKQKEGTMSVKTASDIVKPILIKKKKAEMLSKKLESGTLDVIAQKEKTTVQDISDASLTNPAPSLQGDKAALGAMLSIKEGTLLRNVVGNNGVYAVQLNTRIIPAVLNSYEPLRLQLEKNMPKDGNVIYGALRDASNIGELNLQ
jgi:peptidylprolyl isomerase/peptidyl-prolyl cis-trans isomerase D